MPLPSVKIVKKEGEVCARIFEQDEDGEYTRELKFIRKFDWNATVAEPNLIYITLTRQVGKVDIEDIEAEMQYGLC